MGTSNIVKQIGATVRRVAGSGGSGWFGPHMAAASRAISERIPLVDIVLEVRDARVPLSSEYEQLRHFPLSPRRVIVLNKMDLANRLQTKEWTRYFEQQNLIVYGVNSHNKENVKELLKFLQAQVRALKRANQSSYTTTIMLVGIPNVGKSALANSLHQIGRISAEEKGKLKHANVSPQPGETKNISSLKIGSHPNIYVLDTPGVFCPVIFDDEVCSKLALTGAIRDCLVGKKELAQYFLAILNLNDEYKKWAKLFINESEKSPVIQEANCLGSSDSNVRRNRQFLTDHTQDFIVHKVRRVLFDTISSFDGNLGDEADLARLIEAQLIAMRGALHVPVEAGKDDCNKVATKLLNLFQSGRLGHYTLDSLPTNVQ